MVVSVERSKALNFCGVDIKLHYSPIYGHSFNSFAVFADGSEEQIKWDINMENKKIIIKHEDSLILQKIKESLINFFAFKDFEINTKKLISKSEANSKEFTVEELLSLEAEEVNKMTYSSLLKNIKKFSGEAYIEYVEPLGYDDDEEITFETIIVPRYNNNPLYIAKGLNNWELSYSYESFQNPNYKFADDVFTFANLYDLL